MKNKKNNRYLIIGIGYLILFFIVLTPDINNAVGRGIQARSEERRVGKECRL